MDVLKKIKEILGVKLGNKDQAYLYGSQARGTSNVDSDWDILVILDKEKIRTADYDNVSYPLTSLGWDIGQIISPVLYTTKEWHEQRFTPFYANVKQDAVRII